MFNVRLADGHLYGTLMFTWLSLVMSMIVSFCVLSFFPWYILDEIWNLTGSVSEGFSTYSNRAIRFESSLIYISPASFFTGLSPTTSAFPLLNWFARRFTSEG